MRRVAADLVQRDEPVVAVERSVLDALGDDRAGELLEPLREVAALERERPEERHELGVDVGPARERRRDGALDVTPVRHRRSGLPDTYIPDPHPLVPCHQDLRNGRHADGIGAKRTQHPQLRARLEAWPGQHQVHAFLQRYAGPFRGASRQGAEVRVERIGHGDEARAEVVQVRPRQRVVAGQVDDVGDQHHVTRVEGWIDPTRCIGHHQRPDAQR